MNNALEKARDTISFDEIKEWLISKSGNYKSEYIQASIVMLRELFEEKQALAAIGAEKPPFDSEHKQGTYDNPIDAEKPSDDAASCAGHVVAVFANGGTLGAVLNDATLIIQQFAIEHHKRECGKCTQKYWATAPKSYPLSEPPEAQS